MLIKIMSQNEAKLDRISVTLSIDDLILSFLYGALYIIVCPFSFGD
jgi:hypothetical protein